MFAADSSFPVRGVHAVRKQSAHVPRAPAPASDPRLDRAARAVEHLMALQAIGARLEGDNYQHRFFWYQAAQLLLPRSAVTRVVLECDEASGMDDVAVFYALPGIAAGACHVEADYFQVKYHVDQRSAYAADRLVASEATGTRSLLARIADAYRAVKAKHTGYRLTLLSNWDWATDDPLRMQIYDTDGALRRELLTATGRSALAKIRTQWLTHLAMNAEDFGDFARRLPPRPELPLPRRARRGPVRSARSGWAHPARSHRVELPLRRSRAEARHEPHE